MKEKRISGITLIALIVTIIVLLILVGVTLNLIAGENGILNRATNSVSKHTEEAAREKLDLALQALRIDKMSGEKINIDETLKKEGFTVIDDIIIVDGYQFMIDKEKLEITASLGIGKLNETIQITVNQQVTEDKMQCLLEITIELTGTIQSVMLDGNQLTEENGIYTTSITKNGIYTIIVRDHNDGYQIKNVEISELIEPLEIWTEEELIEFAKRVNAGESFEQKVVVLKKDMNLENINWEPIGYYTSEEDYIAFKGIFDGENHTINHLKIYKEYGEDLMGVGFFGCLETGTLKNLKFNQPEVQSTYGATAIAVGYLYTNGKIENVITLNGTVDGGGELGGICGRSKGTIKNCGNNANIKSNSWATAGIVGYVEPEIGEAISYCYNKGKIEAPIQDSAAIGGIVRNIKCQKYNKTSV